MTIFEVADVVYLPPMLVQNLPVCMGVDCLSQRERTGYQGVKVVRSIFVLFWYNEPFIPIVTHNIGKLFQGIRTGIITVSVNLSSSESQRQKVIKRIAMG